ncbi:LCP family protein [Candidatus Haliotispira prima]|uniref:LCP family protein n=1 Tax=Candidatus Haliotispira prima TaxID=3034016 RepID=A0ABY8MFQ8_9SPIO|nr:LCP family protein [Candidatus Haliotispira prima]
MSNNIIYDPNQNKKVFSRIYGVLFFVLIIALITVIFTLIRTDVVTNSVLKKENVPFLLIISDENGPLLTEAVLFNAKTKRLALIDVPYEAGDLLSDLKRSDRYSVFYQQGDGEAYKRSIENLLRFKFLFTLDINIEDLVKLVDLLEGISLYFFAPIDRINPSTQKRYIYHAGEQLLDGDRSRDFLYAGTKTIAYPEYLELKRKERERASGLQAGLPGLIGSPGQAETDELAERIEEDNSFEKSNILRQKNLRFVRELLLRIVSTLQEYSSESEEYINLIYNYFRTDLNRRSLSKLLLYLGEIDVPSAEVIFQDYLGKVRMVQGKKINFPIYNGEVIRSQVVRISTQLQTRGEIVTEEYPVRIEVLNGTNIAGLASRTAAIYSRAGFDIIRVDNADRSDYEKTVVVNLHSNSLNDVRRVADLIGAANVVLTPLPGGEQAEAEVRVVLGRDFDGNRVEK